MGTKDTRNITNIFAKLQARFGQHMVSTGQELFALSTISTGFAELDAVLKGDGIPRGQLTEVVGIPTSGVTTLAYQVAAQAQQQGQLALYIDLGETFDPEYAAACGIQLEHLLLMRPPTLTSALDSAFYAITTQKPYLLIVDTGIFSQHEIVTVSRLQRLVSALRASESSMVWLTLNHVPTAYLVSYASVRLYLERQDWQKTETGIAGYQTRIHILKQKYAPPTPPILVNIAVRVE